MTDPTTLTPQPLPRGWSFKRYDDSQTDVEAAAREWKRSTVWEDCDWMIGAAEDVAERFAAVVMALQATVDPDILVEVLCEREVALRSPSGHVYDTDDVSSILYAATRRALNRRQGGRPYHPSHEAGKAVAA